MEPFQKTKRPLILHQKIMGNPNMKSIDDKKVVQSPCRREKKGKDFFGENQPGIPEGKKLSPEKKPEGTPGTQHTIGNKEQNKRKKRGLLIPEGKNPRKKSPGGHTRGTASEEGKKHAKYH